MKNKLLDLCCWFVAFWFAILIRSSSKARTTAICQLINVMARWEGFTEVETFQINQAVMKRSRIKVAYYVNCARFITSKRKFLGNWKLMGLN